MVVGSVGVCIPCVQKTGRFVRACVVGNPSSSQSRLFKPSPLSPTPPDRHGVHIKELSPELRKPLHSQVVALREERVGLLEAQRKLRDTKDTLTRQLEKASETISNLQAKLNDSEAERARLTEELMESKRNHAMTEALASQLRIEASQWQARLEQGEADRVRHASEEEVERRRSAEHTEAERFRLLADIANAHAGARRRRISGEVKRTPQPSKPSSRHSATRRRRARRAQRRRSPRPSLRARPLVMRSHTRRTRPTRTAPPSSSAAATPSAGWPTRASASRH